MTIPVAVLLAVALWTLIILFGSVGVYRWSRVLIGRAAISERRAHEVQGVNGIAALCGRTLIPWQSPAEF
jgi:hypothetical protein